MLLVLNMIQFAVSFFDFASNTACTCKLCRMLVLSLNEHSVETWQALHGIGDVLFITSFQNTNSLMLVVNNVNW